MQVVRDSDVQNPSEFFKIAYCKRCDKQRTVAKESGVCTKCAKKIVEGIFQSLSYWR